MITLLPVVDIRTDGGTEPRVAMDDPTLADYIQDLSEGAAFPPVTVFYDGSEYWLADGYHRLAAAVEVQLSEIEAEVHQGDRREALLFALGANAKHGLRRSNADKRRAVLTMLQDPEWSAWSNRELARRSATSHTFVAKMRKEIEGDSGESPELEGVVDSAEEDVPMLSAQETLESGVLPEVPEGDAFDESFGGPEELNFDIEERPASQDSSEAPFYEDMPPGEQYAPVQPFESSSSSSGGGSGARRPTDSEMEQVLELLGTIEKLGPGARLLLFEELRMRYHDFFAAAA